MNRFFRRVFSYNCIVFRFIFFWFVTVLWVWGQNINNDQSNVFSSFVTSDGLAKEIKVSFFPIEPKYHISDNLEFQVSIQNVSDNKKFDFNFFEERFNQFVFTVKKNFQNYSVKQLNYYRFEYLKESYNQRFKKINIANKEDFGFRLNLQDFFDFNQPGVYHIEGNFYPLGVLKNNYKIKIQPFVFRVHPQVDEALNVNKSYIEPQKNTTEVSADWAIDQGQTKNKKSIANPPDYVVRDYFKRIQISDYEEYFANLDLAKLLVNSYNSTEEYQRFVGANPYEKKIILEDFKIFLIENLNYTLVESTILKTIIVKDRADVEAVVAVRESFENFRRTVDPQTGTIVNSWVEEPINRLNKYYYLTFGLEEIPTLDSVRWKIVRYDVNVISRSDYFKYQDGVSTEDKNEMPFMAENEDGLIKTINFSVNGFRVEANYLLELKKLVNFLVENSLLKVNLIGHTDKNGDEGYNFNLSARRVEAVAEILISEGVDPLRINKSFKGETEPITLGINEEQRRLNRRVEIIVNYPSL